VTAITLRTCAKVNFCLRVLGRRPDGYHNVETILHTVGLWDVLRLRLIPDQSGVSVEAASTLDGGSDLFDVPTDESNLCWQAAALLAERRKQDQGVSITLEKAIPVGAGLGGGSSDAAATLVGLAQSWGMTMTGTDLEALASQLGADVPFFLRGGCCLARGKGERLETLPSAVLWLVLVMPDRRVSTAQAYAALGRGATRGRRRELSRPVQRAREAVTQGTLQALAASLHNDFEAVRMSSVEEALGAKAALLDAGCLGAGLSGTGPAVFGIAEDQAEAEHVGVQMRARWHWVRVVPTVPAGEHLVISGATSEGLQ